jgi:regulator of sirC expression with transglutaminase-like and TPR domain
MRSEARDRFAALVDPSVPRIALAEAALWIAKAEYPELDVESYLDRLDELGEEAHRRVAHRPAEEAIARYHDFLFRENGFSGNAEHYEDPRNSFLNDVLDRRLGIPITLSLVYTEVAARSDLPVVGVGFPGHFLVKWIAPREVLVDPFARRTTSRDECLERLRSAYGPAAVLEERLLAPVTPREVLARMLRNLKYHYLGSGDLERALSAVDRIVLVTPDDPAERRDRGVLYYRLECFAAALADFERYLELAPGDAMAAEVRARLPELRREAARVQ